MADDEILNMVLAKLDGVRQHSGYWMAQCPAHDDGKASLSVARGTEQPVLLDCKAGCDVADVLAKLGLTTADVSKPRDGERDSGREWTPFGDAIAVYSYVDENGELLFQVCRTKDKQFPQRVPDKARKSGWNWKLGNTRRVLYRLPAIVAAVNAGQTVYVSEGEKDVHALERAGAVATCNPGGADKWRDEYSMVLAGADVVIVADKDKPGREHAGRVADGLRANGVSKVRVVEAVTGKDASDHLAAGHGLDDFRPIADSDPRESVISESAVPDTSDSSDSDSEDDDAALLDGVRDGAWLTTQDFPPLAYAIDGLVPEGFTIIVGPPKAGKSWLTLALLLAVASGGIALSAIKAAPARRVLYLALEDGDRRMQDRCRALLGDGEDIPPLFSYLTRIQPGMILVTIDAWLRRHPDTAMIVVDTLGKAMPNALNGESAYQRDYRIGTALKDRADTRPGLAVVVLHHDRKATADDFVDSVSGTHGLAGAADTVMVLCRKRQSAEGFLKVTGRDVPEDSYALTITDGKTWQLDGASLRAAAAKARDREDSQALGDTMMQVLAVVREHPEGIRGGDLVGRFGKDVYQYLKRLTEAGRIDKVARGLYVTVSEPSGLSEAQVAQPSEADEDAPVSEAGELWPEGSAGDEAAS